MNEITIIGAGMAGLMAGWQAAKQGKKVKIVAKGWGATHWLSGCIDIVGYYPVDGTEVVENPVAAVKQIITDNPQHPYGLVGLDDIEAMISALKDECAAAGYPLHGELHRNWLLPSAVGTLRPTCLAPEMMIAGDMRQNSPLLIVGFKQLMDFFPNVVSDNLNKQGITAAQAMVDLRVLRERSFINPVILAEMLEQPAVQKELANQIKPHLGQAERVGFPSVLGMDQAMTVKKELERLLGRPVFEIPSLTPSVPGMRLHHILTQAIVSAGGRIENGMEAIGAKKENGKVTAVYTSTAARPHPHRSQQYILATGGILGGGITTNSDGDVREVVFDLPVTAPLKQVDWFHQDFLDKRGHPIYQSGLSVNKQFQPLDDGGQPVYGNVFAIGTTLAHCEAIRERSFEGVALATGYALARQLGAT
ncbi:MAG: glycerol-3-phosphate dehydrogenase subunit GlpB [Ardenticatenaceae bacterium]|nr:glycerol-3-phosphate dehydrogenase subunit GlpB [Ardenticatenaceae bacterium]